MGEMTNVVALANSAIRNRLKHRQAKRVCRLTPRGDARPVNLALGVKLR